jgi:hypothetical protein
VGKTRCKMDMGPCRGALGTRHSCVRYDDTVHMRGNLWPQRTVSDLQGHAYTVICSRNAAWSVTFKFHPNQTCHPYS